MANEVQIFENAEFGKVRTIVKDGEPYFVGKDVADILGYTNSRKAIGDHVDEEDKNTVTIRDGIQGNPNVTIINESGLYSLILYLETSCREEVQALGHVGSPAIHPQDRQLHSEAREARRCDAVQAA